MKAGRFFGIVVVTFVLALFLAGESSAQKKFPMKPITVIIPFQPGDTDTNLRPFTEKMAQYLGQPLNFVYKPGASGSVGAQFVGKVADPDGYTLVGSQQSSLCLVPLTTQGVAYTYRDFYPVCGLAGGYNVIAVQTKARWKNIKELLAEAKQNPGKISYGSGSGALGITTLIAEAFFKEAGVKLNLIPAQGSGPAVVAILGGHTESVSSQITPAFPHIQAGTLRALVVSTEKRVSTMPDVPTCKELGYDVVVPSIYGLMAPKATPKDVVETIAAAAKKASEEHKAAIEASLSKSGMMISYRSPEQFMEFLKSQSEYWTKTVKALDIKL
jgi:tripartite-type tricarboxylate transporter receptor subunit TctC